MADGAFGSPSRSKMIAALAALDSVPEATRFPHLMPDGTRVMTWGEAQAWCAGQLGRSVRTVQRAYAGFKARGEEAFQRSGRSDRGTSRFFRSHRKAAIFAAYFHLAHVANYRAVYRAILANADLLDLPADEAPSYETARMWLKFSLRTHLVSSALEGQNQFHNIAADWLRRGSARARKARSSKRDV